MKSLKNDEKRLKAEPAIRGGLREERGGRQPDHQRSVDSEESEFAQNRGDQVEKWKRKAKKEKLKYKRLLKRYRDRGKELDSMKRSSLQYVKDLRELDITPGWEFLFQSTREQENQYNLAVKKIEAFLNQLSLARAINTVTSLMTRVQKSAGIAFNPISNENVLVKDFLSQAARKRREEFIQPYPKGWSRDTLMQVKKLEEKGREEDDFAGQVNMATEVVGKLEAQTLKAEDFEVKFITGELDRQYRKLKPGFKSSVVGAMRSEVERVLDTSTAVLFPDKIVEEEEEVKSVTSTTVTSTKKKVKWKESDDQVTQERLIWPQSQVKTGISEHDLKVQREEVVLERIENMFKKKSRPVKSFLNSLLDS
jgi:hypothetical protein